LDKCACASCCLIASRAAERADAASSTSGVSSIITSSSWVIAATPSLFSSLICVVVAVEYSCQRRWQSWQSAMNFMWSTFRQPQRHAERGCAGAGLSNSINTGDRRHDVPPIATHQLKSPSQKPLPANVRLAPDGDVAQEISTLIRHRRGQDAAGRPTRPVRPVVRLRASTTTLPRRDAG
jgi:hypothetical protein